MEEQHRGIQKRANAHTPLMSNPWVQGGVTFLPVLAIAEFAHFGPAGFLAGGIAAVVVSQFGGDVVSGVKGMLHHADDTIFPEHVEDDAPRPTYRSERTIWDRLAGRFPEYVPPKDIYDDDRAEDRGDIILLPEPQPPEKELPTHTSVPARPGYVVNIPSAITLASNFAPDVNDLIGAGIVVFGSKGSGKTNVGALLAEQFSRFLVPLVIFDIEGDYASVVDEFPNGYRMNADTLGIDLAFQAGLDILENGYQVVFDLASYESDEEAAAIMIQVIAGMTEWANSQPPVLRVPCPVFLDEAAYWLPQQKVSYLAQDTQKALLDTFHVLATKGRKRGLTPILLTQRISELKKEAMAQADIYFLGKQSLDIDLDRYMEYVKKGVATREDIEAFGPGQFLVKLATGLQFITRFHQRRSKHVSHTPRVQAAQERYARVQRRPAPQERYIEPMEDLPMKVVPTAQSVATRRVSELDKALQAWNEGHTSVARLEKALNVTHHRAYQLYQSLKENRLI